ncbi:MAG: DNA topoisomerase III, partial [Muribaculaceae bacterium]|nr:DNA topoisomerase III [Muribaculaceae bacterium]
LNSLSDYQDLLQNIRGSKLRKSKKVFDNSKVTDHHAIIPTGQPLPGGLTPEEQRVFDLIARRFISVFFPDCTFEQTIVKGKAGKQEFKATGKVIKDKGWKTVYAKEEEEEKETARQSDKGAENESTLPVFTKGEHGPHDPFLAKKTSQPPKYYTEGTLLKAMETAGSTVEDEDLREALKANGIGRPSTRANIIETLFKRGYIRRDRKSLRATPEGCELIGVINEELLKSAKLTGIWEGRLRRIEQGDYSAEEFIAQLKQMITEITLQVLRDPSSRRIGAATPESAPEAAAKAKGSRQRNTKQK